MNGDDPHVRDAFAAAADGIAHLVEERNDLREQVIALAANVESVKRELRAESAELDHIAEVLGRRPGVSVADQVRGLLEGRAAAAKLARCLLDDRSTLRVPDRVLEVATEVLHHVGEP